jgi:DNA-binding CsgD family transcriptional regulator
MRHPQRWRSELPHAIASLAASARCSALFTGEGHAAAHLQAPDGSWWALHAWVLDSSFASDSGSGPDRSLLGEMEATVVVQRARGPELAEILMRGFGLTAGERDVCRLVRAGFSTREIAAQLFLSPYTVQDRLKQIFAKAAVGSRGELVARLS